MKQTLEPLSIRIKKMAKVHFDAPAVTETEKSAKLLFNCFALGNNSTIEKKKM